MIPHCKSRQCRGTATVLLLVWILSIAFGLYLLLEYSSTPGDSKLAKQNWPSESRLAPKDQFNLVMFAHPLCPCTTASIRELERVLAKTNQQVNCIVVFYAEGTRWNANDSSTWQMTTANSRFQSVRSEDSHEVNAFGAMTSGELFLYSPTRELMFHGGITGSRGHEGSNAGAVAVVRLINGDPCSVDTSPIFGCPLTVKGTEDEE